MLYFKQLGYLLLLLIASSISIQPIILSYFLRSLCAIYFQPCMILAEPCRNYQKGRWFTFKRQRRTQTWQAHTTIKHFTDPVPLILTRDFHHHFVGDEHEAQKSQVTCPGTHSSQVVLQDQLKSSYTEPCIFHFTTLCVKITVLCPFSAHQIF